MARVRLIEHDEKYAERLLALSSHIEIQRALGLYVKTRADILAYICQMREQEQQGKVVSRVILNEHAEPIGVTTLMLFDHAKKHCHIATWLGQPYWHKGYNQASKDEILNLAFYELGMKIVFSGIRASNHRSCNSQIKLPYICLDLAREFPEVHEMLEAKEGEPCLLNGFMESDFRLYQARASRNNVAEHPRDREVYWPQIVMA
ncbi:GNAT family N-acetyltransferase [Phytohalomonas tamaricis]|uniref:GNAT family N-acetyltransferase n=1 Tax=Phytohalomonas tamaricis TaxID=2081032 RepID=UPI000D0B53E3|nr:GNAT family N-acetyltransferase [Phytohalomonas tamaricis]